MSKSDLTLVENSLPPIFNEKCEVLVLGTMASPRSRELGINYGHPQNRFWPVIAALFGEEDPKTNDGRRQLALKHHIALWDVLASCNIKGASDASIKDPVPNDISLILDSAPIRQIFCTGTKAAQLYRKLCEPRLGRDCIQLPSTSPANARMSFEDLLKSYNIIKETLQSLSRSILNTFDH